MSMSADGQNLVALLGKPGADEFETTLATWDLSKVEDGPKLTSSGDRMKFITAAALKAGSVLLVGRQEWTGALGGCGEGNSTGSTKTFVSKVYLTNSAQSEFEEPFADKQRALGVSEQTKRCFELAGTASLVSGLPLDPERVIIAQTDMASFSASYYRYNLRSKETELLFRSNRRETPGLFDPRTGDLLTKNKLEPSGDFEQQVLILNPDTKVFETHEIFTTKLRDRFSIDIAGLDEASGKFYVLTDQFSDLVQAWMYDPKTRKFDEQALLAHPQFSIASVVLGTRASDFNQVVGFTVAGLVPEATWIEPRLRAAHEGLKAQYPGQMVDILGYTDARDKVLFSTESPRHPPAYFLLVESNRVVALGSSRPGISPDDIGDQRWVSYKARDGADIPAILDLPAGWSTQDGALPTVIHPHGGPWARDFGGWDGSGWVPFFTSRGYAVLRPQYRGSMGLGRKLWMSGDAEWGQKMQDDKDDGAAWLVEQGIADPNRMMIFGYSYGGFAAAAAVVRPNSPYQCAIAGAPVTDLKRLGNRWSENRIQRLLQGRTVTGMDPMQNADKANIPVLLYVGDRDVRTPSWHAKDFYNAVKGKVPAKFELIADQPHSFPWYPRHMRTQLQLIEEFIAGSCKMGAEKAVAAAN
jgi:dienelactone hydrolase